jgi:hypothetical protein
LSARDIEIFKLLARYRYLRSTYIHAFVGGASETRFKERLGDLFHEGYLNRPTQQWEYADARCRPVVHELGVGAARTLRDCGTDVASAFPDRGAHRQFRHSLMICEALASLELGACACGLRFIPWPEMLARAPEATRAAIRPFRLPVPSGGYIVPDGAFGIEYRNGAATAYRFFALEADRGTMPVRRARQGQTSYMAKLAAYRDVIRYGAHRAHWGIPNLLVLTLTTSESRLAEMLSRSGEDADLASPAFLFKAVRENSLTVPLPELFAAPWERVGTGPLSIAESR